MKITESNLGKLKKLTKIIIAKKDYGTWSKAIGEVTCILGDIESSNYGLYSTKIYLMREFKWVTDFLGLAEEYNKHHLNYNYNKTLVRLIELFDELFKFDVAYTVTHKPLKFNEYKLYQ